MIILKLQGGLGNQMFQYSAGLALSKRLNTTLRLDISYYKNDKKRKFSLDDFNISAKEATEKDILSLSDSILINAYKKIFRRHAEKKMFANSYFYDKSFEKISDNSIIEGFWQNEKYFKDVEKIIRHEFRLKNDLSEKSAELERKINGDNSVSVHIRRGDYTLPKYRKIFYECSVEYYTLAIKYILDIVPNAEFFVFSDDLEWAKNIPFPKKTNFVGKELGLRDSEELILMSRCKHNIIANSSFSWWAAWLNQNDKKIVIGPKNWSSFQTDKLREPMPETWYKI